MLSSPKKLHIPCPEAAAGYQTYPHIESVGRLRMLQVQSTDMLYRHFFILPERLRLVI
jgi:hypothetical protein